MRLTHTQPPPVDLAFRHAVTTPPERLNTLIASATDFLAQGEQSFPALASAIGATKTEARDAVQALGRSVALFCCGKGWRLRLRSSAEMRLVADNDNTPAARILVAA